MKIAIKKTNDFLKLELGLYPLLKRLIIEIVMKMININGNLSETSV